MAALTDDLEGKQLLGTEDHKLGKITGVFNDVKTGQPAWVAVSTGLFGRHETLVPTDAATMKGDDVVVPYSKDQLKDAPHHDPDDELTVEQERALFSHYGVDHGGYAPSPGTAAAPEPQVAPVAPVTAAAPTTGDSLTLHEERAHAGVETVATGQARLRKVVVTENRTITVPVTHEEVQVVHEAVGAGEDTGEAFGDGEVSVTLHEQRPVVSTETVATERVRLATTEVTEDATVDATVRKEQVRDVTE